jgi:hypothetical protein
MKTNEELIQCYAVDHPASLVARLVTEIGVNAAATLLNLHAGESLRLPARKTLWSYFIGRVARERLGRLRGKQRRIVADELVATYRLVDRGYLYRILRKSK